MANVKQVGRRVVIKTKHFGYVADYHKNGVRTVDNRGWAKLMRPHDARRVLERMSDVGALREAVLEEVQVVLEPTGVRLEAPADDVLSVVEQMYAQAMGRS